MSDTPRTDAVLLKAEWDNTVAGCNYALQAGEPMSEEQKDSHTLSAVVELSRQLERELSGKRPEAGERMSKTSAEIYFAGIDDAISYLGGCTFGASEMSTVRGVLSLLKAFKRQGGYSAYKLPERAPQNGSAK